MKLRLRKWARPDLMSAVGLLAGIGLVLYGQTLEGGAVQSLFQLTAAIIVLGGTLGAVLLSFPAREVRRAVRALAHVFLIDTDSDMRRVAAIVKYATDARKNGLMAIEDDVELETDAFLKKGLRLAVDGTSPQELREILEIDDVTRQESDELPARVFESAGAYAPTFGILGAVLGLIHVMKNLADPSKLGPGIAVAFVATVYGIGAANLIFLPMATKLRARARDAARCRDLTIEGVLGIRDGLNPRLIELKLGGFLTHDASSDRRRGTGDRRAGADRRGRRDRRGEPHLRQLKAS